jgi:hypothetical protein
MSDKPVNQAELVAKMSPAEYDAWVEKQIAIGLREANDPATVWVSNDDVMRMLDEKRTKWQQQAAEKIRAGEAVGEVA